MKEVGVKYSLLTTLTYSAQAGRKSRLYSYSFPPPAILEMEKIS